MGSRGHRRSTIGALTLGAVALVALSACGGKSSGTSGPSASSATAAQGKQVKGTLTVDPGVSAQLHTIPGPARTWLATLMDGIVRPAEAVATPLITVHLDCTGGPSPSTNLTTTTNPSGKFEFNNVQGTSCSITADVGTTLGIPVATVALGSQPAEVEGRLRVSQDQAGGPPTVTPRKLEVETDVDDENGHHSEHHGSDDQGGQGGKKGKSG